MIWTRDAEDSLTYAKSNKKVRKVDLTGMCDYLISLAKTITFVNESSLNKCYIFL